MSGQAGDISQYFQAIMRRLWLVAIVVVVAVSAVFLQAGRAPGNYTATASLLVTAPVIIPAPSVAVGADPGLRPGMREVTNDIIELINSRPIAARVAKRLDLAGPGPVQRAVSASTVRNTSVIRVTATARNPRQAADLANITAEEFVAYFRETNRASVAESRRFMEAQLAQARGKLEASDRTIQTFKERHQMPSVSAATTHILTAIANGENELDASTLALRQTEARLAAVRTRLAQEKPVIVASQATTDNPVFRQIQTRLIDLEIQRAQLSQVYTPQHPRLDQIAREIADVRGRLMTEARTYISQEVTTTNPIHTRLLSDIVGLEVEQQAAAARVEALQITQRRRQAAGMAIPSTETDFNRLMRENRVMEANYTTLATRYQDVLIRENQAGFYPASLQLVEAATPPTRPMASSFPRTAAAAGLAGLVLGIAAVLFLESLDDSIRNAQDAERAFGGPVLAEIPTQGNSKTTSPTVVFTVGIVLAAAVATGAVARGYVGVPAVASDGIRSVTATVTSWVTGAQPAVGNIGIAEGDR